MGKEFESNGGAWRQLLLCVRQSERSASTAFGCDRVGNLPTYSHHSSGCHRKGVFVPNGRKSLNPRAVLGDNFCFAYSKASGQ